MELGVTKPFLRRTIDILNESRPAMGRHEADARATSRCVPRYAAACLESKDGHAAENDIVLSSH
jgi:hypothetical protein